MNQSTKLHLCIVAASLLFSAGTLAEAPEAIHRCAYFHLDSARLGQSMFLEAALRHKLLASFPCSSLEGASCLYSHQTRHDSGIDGALLDGASDAQLKQTSKVKLVLLKPEKGQSIEDFLEKMKLKSNGAVRSSTDLLNDGQVMFEGNPASLSDVETLANTMINALGLPQGGDTAEGLRRQLTRALTDAEFAASKLIQRKQVEAGSGEDSEEGDGEEAEADDSEAAEGEGEEQQDAADSARGSRSAEQASRSRRKRQSGNGAAAADDVDRQGALGATSADELAVSVRELLASIKALQGDHGLQRFEVEDASSAGAQPAEPLQPPAKQPAAEPTVGSDPQRAAQRVYVDDETGEEFVLPADKGASAHSEEVFVDDETGRTYVVNDGEPAGSRRGGTLSRRLSDNMAWLDGLTDEEYDTYMDQYYDELDREDQEREERQRQNPRQRTRKH